MLCCRSTSGRLACILCVCVCVRACVHVGVAVVVILVAVLSDAAHREEATSVQGEDQ